MVREPSKVYNEDPLRRGSFAADNFDFIFNRQSILLLWIKGNNFDKDVEKWSSDYHIFQDVLIRVGLKDENSKDKNKKDDEKKRIAIRYIRDVFDRIVVVLTEDEKVNEIVLKYFPIDPAAVTERIRVILQQSNDPEDIKDFHKRIQEEARIDEDIRKRIHYAFEKNDTKMKDEIIKVFSDRLQNGKEKFVQEITDVLKDEKHVTRRIERIVKPFIGGFESTAKEMKFLIRRSLEEAAEPFAQLLLEWFTTERKGQHHSLNLTEDELEIVFNDVSCCFVDFLTY